MATPAVSAPLAQLPNALTVFRLVLVPIFVVVLALAAGGYSWAAGSLYVVAGVTDQLDGFLARRWHVESQFGKVADPLADRLMIDAAVILLFLHGRLPWEGLLLILVRDGLLLIGFRLIAARGIDISVNLLGKISTWILYLALGLLMVTHHGTRWPLDMFWAGLALAGIATVIYVVSAWRLWRA
jgi:CDP-diacylglycerol--glycerol-3-phosphate 3-phosphatidyltransferase